MIKTEMKNGFIHTWSDSGFYIHGGSPEGDYAEAYDPEDSGRTYTETDKAIKTDEKSEATVEDYQAAMRKAGILR